MIPVIIETIKVIILIILYFSYIIYYKKYKDLKEENKFLHSDIKKLNKGINQYFNKLDGEQLNKTTLEIAAINKAVSDDYSLKSLLELLSAVSTTISYDDLLKWINQGWFYSLKSLNLEEANNIVNQPINDLLKTSSIDLVEAIINKILIEYNK